MTPRPPPAPVPCAALDEVMASSHVEDRACLHELAADLALRCGRADVAASDIERAFAHVEATGEGCLPARLWALRAQIAAAKGDNAEELRCRRHAAEAGTALG